MEVRVRDGDSFSYYGRLFRVPLELITDSNVKANAVSLKPGEKIVIPGYVSVPYTIEEDDTLWKIGNEKNVPIDAIMILNQMKNPNRLIPGEILYLPERIVKQNVSSKLPFGSGILVKQIKTLKKYYPFINVETIGTSVLGNPIQEIRIGKGLKKVHMNASFHANEWITTMIVMNLVNRYLISLTNRDAIRGINTINLYNETELSIVPMVNPDGVDLVLNGPPKSCRDEVVNINEGSNDFVHWKANIRGVDLNNQFPANWEIEQERKEPKSPAPRDYPGESSLSEPEAIAMANLMKKNHYDRILAFHTQGEEFYWGYEGFEPLESGILAKEFERVSGYKAIRNVDSHAGFKDWYIQEFKRPGFTIELGRGINPLPLSQFHDILLKVEGIFLASLYL
ncbi:M14 family metallopeptidase [Neobacillus niacini]|uniref:M14 family metallopeptidase n=1 Tax=Neobacillus niacini TaxID=86668 RepID=UPI00203EA6A9|nr:M14 family metallopeptidase [Neobacillus niacini]MCM3692430.1 LysM peptidoglycan-binding domain-containing protein [Neobacillus niacini]